MRVTGLQLQPLNFCWPYNNMARNTLLELALKTLLCPLTKKQALVQPLSEAVQVCATQGTDLDFKPKLTPSYNKIL